MAAPSQRPPAASAGGDLHDRARTCLTVTRFLAANELSGDLEATDARIQHLVEQLDELGPTRGERQVEQLENILLEVDAHVGEPVLLSALAGTKDAQRRAYVRLLAVQPITSHRRLERFLRLCRRMGERREAFKPGELLDGLPRRTDEGAAERAVSQITAQRARLRKASAEEFFEGELYLELRTERHALAADVAHPKVLTAMLRFEAELQARIDAWTRELHGSPSLHGRSPKEYIGASLRRQEKKLRNNLGETGAEVEARKPAPEQRALGAAADSLSEQLDAMAEARRSTPPQPTRLDRLRAWADENSRAAVIASAVVFVLALGAVALSLSNSVEESVWESDTAQTISPLLRSGHQRGTHLDGRLDPGRWAALNEAERKDAAEKLSVGLKERGVFTANLTVEGLDEPAIVIQFARVKSIGK